MAAKKTPEQRLAELNERQAKIERELKQRKEKIAQQKRQQQAKIAEAKRKRETRQKVLIGAAMLAKIEAGEWSRDNLTRLLHAYLTRDDDRALFGLPPIVGGDDAGTTA